MGRMRESTKEEAAAPLPSLSEALLFSTMCIIGLPVQVHIKDGSVFSGIFHTASFDNGYGIVLKTARMIKKGTLYANVPNDGLIITLVILPEDLVQVVAKGVMLPADSTFCSATCDDEEAISRSSDSFQGLENEALGGELLNQERQVGVDSPLDVEDGCCRHFESMKGVLQVHDSNTSLNGCYTERSVHKENHAKLASNQLANGSLSACDKALNVKLMNQFRDSQLSKEFKRTESVASEVSSSSKPDPDASRGLVVPAETPPQKSLTSKTAKESKLNPGAKVFSPSFPNFRTTSALVPTVSRMAYVPNSIPGVQVATAQPEVAIRQPVAQRSSWPVKFVPYVNPTPANADNSFQYIPSIAGHIATRAQPVRQGAQYQPIQAVPPYIHTNPQNAMFGRPSQVVYVHQVAHDGMQGPAALSQAPHPLLTSHQIHVPKHEGVFTGQPMQVSVTPPLVATNPFAMSSHIQLSQPVFSSMHPVPVLGSNVSYGAKFP